MIEVFQEYSLLKYVLYVLVGVLVAFINSIAGGGSSVSLPLFIALGMPANVANGTNRFGVVFGSLGSFVTLFKGGFFSKESFKLLGWAVVPAIIGSLFAVEIPNLWFEYFLVGVLCWIAHMGILSVYKPKSNTNEVPREVGQVSSVKQKLLLIFLGFYGGLVQIGFGYVSIWVFSKLGAHNIIRINAVKSVLAFFVVSSSLIVFLIRDYINWPVALCFTMGTLLGGIVGGMFQIKKGQKFIKVLVAGMALALAIKMAFKLIAH